MPRRFILGIFVIFTASLILLTSCKDDGIDPINNSTEQGLLPAVQNSLFTQTNAAAGNNVLVYSRAPDGNLTFVNSIPTQGSGSGTGLGSQGSLAFSRGGSLLLVVNAGSNEISVFKVAGMGVSFFNKVSSGGTMPISITAFGNIVYVLNAGGSGNITGFRYGAKENVLEPIPNSTRFLSNNGIGNSPGPAEISFNTEGTLLVVTEKMTNKILTYTVNPDGTVNGPNVFNSAGRTPFGFSFRGNYQIIVSEAFEGITDSSAVSSYSVNLSGNVGLISGPVFTTETAACWIVVTNNMRYTYTSNTGSGTITGYRINPVGMLTIMDPDGVTANLGAGSSPIDMATSIDSRYLYCLNSGNHTISLLRINGDGSLSVINLASVSSLPAGTSGLLAK